MGQVVQRIERVADDPAHQDGQQRASRSDAASDHRAKDAAADGIAQHVLRISVQGERGDHAPGLAEQLERIGAPIGEPGRAVGDRTGGEQAEQNQGDKPETDER